MKKIIIAQTFGSLVLLGSLAGCDTTTTTNTNTATVVNNNAAPMTANTNAKPAEPASVAVSMEQAKANIDKTLANANATAAEKEKAIKGYVDAVEAEYKAKYTQKEIALKPDALKGVSDEKWAKMHAYYDGAKLRRLKAYPVAGTARTEEFYFDNDKLIYVFVEPQGAGKTGSDTASAGERYYFDNAGLFSWSGADGKMKDKTAPETAKQNQKLTKEAAAFRAQIK